VLACEVKDRRIPAYANLSTAAWPFLKFATHGADNLPYQRAGIDHASEGVEVIKKSAGIIHEKFDLGNHLLVIGNVAISVNDKVGKYLRKVIRFRPPAGVTRTGCRQTVEQRNPREIVERTLEASSFYLVGVKAGAIPEAEGCIPSSVSNLTVDNPTRRDREHPGSFGSL
jgi:hypothetical protein